MPRTIRVFRYNPSQPDTGHFDTYTLDISGETTTTILDVLLRLQQEQDPTLAFRFACRVNMCGSCGMVINGTEALACKTNVSDIQRGREITIRPLNHFPVIKDLVVDMEPFFRMYEEALPFYDPKSDSAEPARIAPDSAERLAIAGATECIACGCCVSSCTMVHDHQDYAGPAALNRAFTLLADSRDGFFTERLDRALASCYDCRTEFNCTEVCPKGISPTRAIKSIQRLALTHPIPAAPSSRRHAWAFGWLGAASIAALAALAFLSPGWPAAAVALVFAVVCTFAGRRHPVFMATGVACSVGMIYLALTAIAAARPVGDTITIPDRPLSASESRGLALFAGQGCAFCHQILGQGGHRVGPDLSNIEAKRRTRDELVRYIRHPRSSAMPVYNLPDDDLRALADFILSLDFSRYPAKTIQREEALRHE